MNQPGPYAGFFEPFKADPTVPTLYSGLANWNTTALLCADWPFVAFDVTWPTGAAPTGTLFLWGSNKPSAPNSPPLFGLDVVNTVNPTVGIYGVWPNVVGANGIASVVVKNPFRWMGVGYTFIAGGAANQFQVAYQLRPVAG